MSATVTIPTTPTRADIAHIVSAVFDDACEDVSVIEEIWAAIVHRHSQPVEIISQTSHSIGQVAVSFTVGRVKP
jgi:hypothetical protein